MGYFDHYYPFVYEEEGTCRGLTRDLLENTAALTGLRLQWKRIDSPAEASRALEDGTIDVMSYCIHSEEEAAEGQLIKLKDYTQVPLVLVMEKDRELHSIQTLATVEYLSEEAKEAVGLEDAVLLVFDTQQACMDAVKERKADAVLCDGYLAEYQLSAEMRYYNLEIKRVLNQEHGISMTVRSDDVALAGVLNKSLLYIDARAVSDYMLERNVYAMTSVSKFVEDNSGGIIAILFLLLLGVLLVTAHIIRDTRKIQKLMYKDVEIDIWNLNHLLYTGKKTLEADRGRHTYAIAYLNIAQFQHYKVVYGWTSGQRLLESVADVLSQCVRGKGAEEFF